MIFRKKGADDTTTVKQMIYRFYCDFCYLNLPTQHFRYAIPDLIIHSSCTKLYICPFTHLCPSCDSGFLARIGLTNHHLDSLQQSNKHLICISRPSSNRRTNILFVSECISHGTKIVNTIRRVI